MTDHEARQLLDRAAAASANSTRRKLLLAAAFSSVALDNAVMVGGVAVEVHTGSYAPTDIDLVGRRRRGHQRVLDGLGFDRDGRHWLYTFPDGETLAIEVPGDQLGDFATDPPVAIDLEPGRLSVIALNDLMMDRLLQATGGESVTLEEAVRLAVATYQRIGWDDLDARARTAAVDGSFAGKALGDVVARVRREARQRLRAARQADHNSAP